jgi:plasmid stabilization system protein ParE
MARTVTWTASAVNDLDSVAEFIAKDSRFYAITVVRKARDLPKSLSVVAQRGRIAVGRT